MVCSAGGWPYLCDLDDLWDDLCLTFDLWHDLDPKCDLCDLISFTSPLTSLACDKTGCVRINERLALCFTLTFDLPHAPWPVSKTGCFQINEGLAHESQLFSVTKKLRVLHHPNGRVCVITLPTQAGNKHKQVNGEKGDVSVSSQLASYTRNLAWNKVPMKNKTSAG